MSSSGAVTNAHQDGIETPSLRLTANESRVLSLLATHLTIDAMAERLERKRSTVKTHVAHIYAKFGAHNRGQAIARARAAGLLADPDARNNRWQGSNTDV
jgi:DNA-binding CsgD family transcriptional regulator